MKRHVLAVIAIILGAAACCAATPPPKKTVPLKIDGDVVMVVKTLPCTVTAPPGAALYFWTLPDGVKGTPADNVLTVTAAPQGASTISVISLTIDFEAKTTVKNTGTVVLTNGYKPPPPPVPPTPADPLAAAFQTAYNVDQDADRASSLAFLAAAYKGMAAQAGTRTDLKTNADFVNWIKAVVGAPGVGLTVDKVKSLRSAVAKELAGKWGATPAPLAAADAAAELSKIAVALAAVS